MLIVAVDDEGRPSIVREALTEAEWLAVIRGERSMEEYERPA